ncbi:LysR family transcriptional regulator [Pseudoduganella namucuonensis]|uniref:DNA-binding transcriptional regulator, LysR family n=1 Tax=Pseudoduganella namucuonensis TaxID=1035707 RepID=A0A1I7LAL5_9BURK|nr:LysR family transcriptional regulator [Pseudoduganella namucuonensis]SFV06576.1 DNA-binding transcriptional regulator, LysR family [Pseudoduganella namucuonensis]
MHNLDWEDLRYFSAICRGGSVSAAARRLGVNHSTVLRRVDGLERALGVRLFERFQSGYVMTAAGEALRQGLGGVEERIDAARRAVGGRDQSLSGEIRVTTTDTLARGMLMPSLARFQQRHPDVRLQLVVNNSFLNLNRREADVALRPSNAPPETLVGRRLGALGSAIYASHAYLRAAAKRGVAADDWPAHDWIGLDDTLAHLAQSRWLAAAVPAHRVTTRVDSLLTMVDAAREGMGMAPLLCLLADQERRLRRVAPPDPSFDAARFDTDVWLLTHRDLKDTARVKALTLFLYEDLRAFFPVDVH